MKQFILLIGGLLAFAFPGFADGFGNESGGGGGGTVLPPVVICETRCDFTVVNETSCYRSTKYYKAYCDCYTGVEKSRILVDWTDEYICDDNWGGTDPGGGHTGGSGGGGSSGGSGSGSGSGETLPPNCHRITLSLR